MKRSQLYENQRMSPEKPLGSSCENTLYFDTNGFFRKYIRSSDNMYPRPNFQKPKAIAEMTRNASGEWLYGIDQGLKKFQLPKFDSKSPETYPDLNTGFEEFCKNFNDPGPESLAHVIEAIHLNKKINIRSDSRVKKVISWRGALKKIMTTPYLYGNYDAWELSAWKIDGVLFIQTRRNSNDIGFDKIDMKSKRFMYYGYAFEDLCTQAEPNNGHNHVEGYHAVFQTKLNDKMLLYGAEIDCYSDHQDERKYIELKVTASMDSNNAKQRDNFESKKLLNYFAQSYLASVDSIFIGFRDNKGFLQNSQMLKILDIPSFVKGKWKASICMLFLDQVLDFLFETVDEQNAFQIMFSPEKRQIELKKINQDELLPYEVFNQATKDKFKFIFSNNES